MNTPTTPTLDFAQIRTTCPKAFAALIGWFCQGKAFDRPLTVDTPQYDGLLSNLDTWIDLRDGQFSAGDFRRVYTLNIRDLYDFFDASRVYVTAEKSYTTWKWTMWEDSWGAPIKWSRADSNHPTRVAAEAAAFTAGFEKLEEILKQKEG